MNNLKKPNDVYVFIDAANLWQAHKKKKRFVDYRKLKRYISKNHNAQSVKLFYYEAYPPEDTRSYSLIGKHKFYSYLKKVLQVQVVNKPLKRIKIFTNNAFIIQEKGNMDVEITIDAVHHISKYNIAVFLTGDSDFNALIQYLKDKNKKVFIMSSKNSISQELLINAHGYTNLLNLDIWGYSIKARG